MKFHDPSHEDATHVIKIYIFCNTFSFAVKYSQYHDLEGFSMIFWNNDIFSNEWLV